MRAPSPYNTGAAPSGPQRAVETYLMPKNMLIDAAHAEETRVAVVDGPRVEEFDFESRAKKQLRGNIYLAKVTRVEPSLQAAFVEYGGNRHGFLAFDEIHPDYYQIPVADREAIMAAADDEDEDADEHESDDDEGEVSAQEARLRRRMMRRYKIQEVIKRRQILLIQVVKEERGNKGAALTTYLSLAGRYCVLMPNTDRGGGISRKITTATDRKRLKTIAQSLEVPQGMGLIVRTAGAKRTKQEIKRDYEYLLRLWESIRETTLKSIAPALIYEEEDLVKRAIRDMFDKDVENIFVEGEEGFRDAREFMRMLMPSQAKKIQLHRDPTPLFVKHRVEDVLQQIHSPVVPLKSGGYIVINQTEALVAVDVNSGRATKERNIEATALKTNLEAADEAARQLRLRDLAGLIVIDFIDMEESKNNRAVEKRMKDALADDRARIQMGKISGFGLMEISRQRRRTGVLEGTTHVCEHCQGSGRVRSVESGALQALRAVEMECVRGGAGACTLRLPAEVALYVLNHKREFLLRLHQTQGLFVTVMVDDSLGRADHAVDRTETLEGFPVAKPEPLARVSYDAHEDDEIADEDEEEVEDEALEAEGDEDEAEDASPREARAPREGGERDRDRDEGRRGGRRRRRRRGGRRDEFDDARPASAEGADAEEGDEDEDRPVAGETEEEGRNRRRRRGRRGGRRMREEGRERDPYLWVRGRTPSLEDPYVWFDPIERLNGQQGARPAAEAPASAAAPEAIAQDAPAAAPPALEAPEADTAAPPKRRRVRARKKSETEETVDLTPAPALEAPADPEPEPVVETVAEPEPLAAEAEPEPAPAPAPEPVLELVGAEAAPPPRAPDPAEISTPPAQPKRGWWRRR